MHSYRLVVAAPAISVSKLARHNCRMRNVMRVAAFGLLLLSGRAIGAEVTDTCTAMKIVSSDIDHFWQAWDLWQGRDAGDPTKLPGDLQTVYLDRASPGVEAFTPHRIQNAANLAQAILVDPAWYRESRPLTSRMVAQTPRLQDICRGMRAIYPETVMPTVYLVMGARNSGGTSSQGGLILGVEMYSGRPDAKISPDDFVALVTHELVHFQQKQNPRDAGKLTLLRQPWWKVQPTSSRSD